uniref:Uncharacterized protein n=1 Tax=Glossina morsitans morsitans TaxID=37546 RepID=A0A1B0G0Q8_GLOMM
MSMQVRIYECTLHIKTALHTDIPSGYYERVGNVYLGSKNNMNKNLNMRTRNGISETAKNCREWQSKMK